MNYKSHFSLRNYRPHVAAFLGLVLLPCLSAQVAVTGVTYNSLNNGSNRTVNKIKYLNEYHSVNTISTGTETYNADGALADSVTFRYSNYYSDDNATVFYQYEDSSYSRYYGSRYDVYSTGDYSPTLEEVMLSNDLTQGLRNPFANGNSSLNGNIERIDFNFEGGYTVQAGDALTFFDLENSGNYGDGFRISAFTSVDGSNTPTAYVNSGLLVEPDTYGAPIDTPTGTDGKYIRSTTSNGENLTGSQSISVLDDNSYGGSDLYLVGILITLEDLGLSVGDVIYGYSLMAGDVNAGSASSLVNWTNTSVYKNNTSSSTWGNVDFMGYGAQLSSPVPEPSTYGALLIGLSTVFFGWKRSRQKRLSAPTA